jgi:hypothetical protein
LHIPGDLLSSPSVSQGNGNRAFGTILSDNVFIQFRNDPGWSKLVMMNHI